ncbi:MAG: hypothetical protein IMZ62_15820 [Chloroflexi bacterium]|nr:hypothetical protein [Chloroflexota bacterium]
MIFSSTTKPKDVEGPTKLRHILADQVKPKVFDFDRNRYKEMNPKRKPGGPITTSQLGDIAAMKKRAEVAAERDVVRVKAVPAPIPAHVAQVIKKKGGRPKKAK